MAPSLDALPSCCFSAKRCVPNACWPPRGNTQRALMKVADDYGRHVCRLPGVGCQPRHRPRQTQIIARQYVCGRGLLALLALTLARALQLLLSHTPSRKISGLIWLGPDTRGQLLSSHQQSNARCSLAVHLHAHPSLLGLHSHASLFLLSARPTRQHRCACANFLALLRSGGAVIRVLAAQEQGFLPSEADPGQADSCVECQP